MSKNSFKGLENNREFIEKLYKQTTDEGVRSVFAEKNITLSDQELNDLKALVFICANNNGELSDEVVEKVSGGGAKKWISNNWEKLAKVSCAVVGTAVGLYELNKLTNAAVGTLKASEDVLYTGASTVDNLGKTAETSIKKMTGVVQGVGNAVHREGLGPIAMGAATGLAYGWRSAT